jgi:SAM-dependent methyltransferase
MRPDVLSIYRFYETALGQQTAQILSERIATHMKPASGATVVGLGYAVPYLDHLAAEVSGVTARHLAFMPAQQGVCHWPTIGRPASCLVDPYHLPLADASVDALLLVHALEYANKPANYLREAWRVLAPGGQIIVIAPNRMRTWSAAEATPFGHGRPYSKGQLFSLMEDQMLPPEAWETALMQPPLSFPGAAGMMRFSERVVGSLGRALGGALLVSARKQVYGALPKGASKARAVPIFTQTP